MRKPTQPDSPDLPADDPNAALHALLLAALAECDAGLLRAEGSQIQFNATRLYLRGRREALAAVMTYLEGAAGPLEELTRA